MRLLACDRQTSHCIVALWGMIFTRLSVEVHVRRRCSDFDNAYVTYKYTFSCTDKQTKCVISLRLWRSKGDSLLNLPDKTNLLPLATDNAAFALQSVKYDSMDRHGGWPWCAIDLQGLLSSCKRLKVVLVCFYRFIESYRRCLVCPQHGRSTPWFLSC